MPDEERGYSDDGVIPAALESLPAAERTPAHDLIEAMVREWCAPCR